MIQEALLQADRIPGWLVQQLYVLRKHSKLALRALAGLCVVLPRIDASSLDTLRTLALLLLSVGLSGVLWVWLGSAPALRGPLLASLNRE